MRGEIITKQHLLLEFGAFDSEPMLSKLRLSGGANSPQHGPQSVGLFPPALSLLMNQEMAKRCLGAYQLSNQSIIKEKLARDKLLSIFIPLTKPWALVGIVMPYYCPGQCPGHLLRRGFGGRVMTWLALLA